MDFFELFPKTEKQMQVLLMMYREIFGILKQSY